MLAQEFFQLIGVEISQHFLAGNEGGDVCLIRQLRHFFVSLAILTDIDLGEAIAALGQVFLCIDAPGTPFTAVKFDISRHGVN